MKKKINDIVYTIISIRTPEYYDGIDCRVVAQGMREQGIRELHLMDRSGKYYYCFERTFKNELGRIRREYTEPIRTGVDK